MANCFRLFLQNAMVYLPCSLPSRIITTKVLKNCSTFSSRRRPRPRPRLHDSRPRQRQRLSFLSSRRLETTTMVSRIISLAPWIDADPASLFSRGGQSGLKFDSASIYILDPLWGSASVLFTPHFRPDDAIIVDNVLVEIAVHQTWISHCFSSLALWMCLFLKGRPYRPMWWSTD